MTNTAEPRTWTLWGHLSETMNNFQSVYSREVIARLSTSSSIDKLIFTEDENGEYSAWIDSGKDDLSLVRLNHLFEMQFSDGSKDKSDRGFGVVVRGNIAKA